MHKDERFDLIIVGGGIGGVVCLHYARKAGLKVLLLERQPIVGGIWAQLPAWQDIQINANDWTVGDLPIDGCDQASILSNIQAWVERFDLAASIRLNCPVTRATVIADGWQITTPDQTYCCQFLVSATGVHGRPVIPDVDRSQATIGEAHSSRFHDPAALADKDVVVVGGGASAYDLLELCFEQRARRIVWVYRSLKWMVPTRKPKHLAGDLRGLSKLQMQGVSVAQMNLEFNLDLRARYEKFGLTEILPEGEFDFDRHQMIPGRRSMIENFARLERHRGEIARISGRTVALSTGVFLDIDWVLWGTGYQLDLSYFDMPVLAKTTRLETIAARCGSLFRSLDAPNLFFLGPALLETTSTSPWAYAHSCRTIVAHLCGKAMLDTEPVVRKLNYFDLPKFLATRDPENYPPSRWYSDYLALAMNHPADQPMPMP
jgi:cation diffusion facilitator CzcD-associated flavoprotein CzcO